jgi:hypothetical protein
VVAYEADMIDPDDHLGWSVIVVGRANRVTDPGEIARYQQALRSWVSGDQDEVIAITAEMVDGFQLTAERRPWSGWPRDQRPDHPDLRRH